MTLNRKALSEQGIETNRQTVSIAYIVIPTDIDRQDYIDSCMRKKTVSILTEGGEYINEVSVGKLAMQLIEFPKVDGNNSRNLGSPVCILNIAQKNKPIIVEVFDATDEFAMTIDNSLTLSKKTSDTNFNVSLLGNEGSGAISFYSNDKENGFDVNINNKKGKAYFKMFVNGFLNLITKKRILLKSGEGIYIEIKDEVTDATTENKNKYTRLSVDNGNLIFQTGKVDPTTKEFVATDSSIVSVTDETIDIKHLKRVNIGSGKEAMILGETMRDFTNEIIGAISSITTTTMLGVQPIINKAQFEALKQQTDKILSKYGFLD